MVNTARTDELKSASLLVGGDCIPEDIVRAVLDKAYSPLDPDRPTLRFRGTMIDARRASDCTSVIGWQRNVARLRKMDVSLPTIVTMRLDRNGTIADIALDRSFKGSKGLMCCRAYLDRNMRTELVGRPFDGSFLHRIKQERMHCAHLFEVLGGMYSFWCAARDENGSFGKGGIASEEEAIDSYSEGGMFHSIGVHRLTGGTTVEYGLSLHDVMKNAVFAKDGTLDFTSDIRATFALAGMTLADEFVSFGGRVNGRKDLSIFLLECIRSMKHALFPVWQGRMLNTNLYPRAFIGMLVQSVAIRLFNDNYNYIMHALTALQSTGGVPLCVGAVADQDEADRFFPGFDFSELI
jgi:hypothetical protein